MEDQKDLRGCIAAIRRLNARFRKMKAKDGPLAARMMAEKDRLIDAMAAACDHPEIFGTRGAKARGPMRLPIGPRRICAKCGHCETPTDGAYAALSGPAETLPFDAYVLRQGAVLKRLGIDL